MHGSKWLTTRHCLIVISDASIRHSIVVYYFALLLVIVTWETIDQLEINLFKMCIDLFKNTFKQKQPVVLLGKDFHLVVGIA